MSASSPEELFGPRPAKPPAESPEELFGPRELIEASHLGGGNFDDYFTTSEAGKILDAFGKGFKTEWGTLPLGTFPTSEKHPSLETQLKGGILPDYEKGLAGPVREINEGLFRPLAILADLTMRGTSAVAHGLLETASPFAIVGAGALAGMETFPAGHFTGFPHMPHMNPIEAAHDLGITDERYPGVTPNETARRAFAPTGEPSQTERVIAGATPTEPPVADAPAITDVHGMARIVDPETFAKYDPLQEQQSNLRSTLDAMKEAQRQSVEAEEKVILDKVGGVEERLTKKAAARLEAIREAGKEYLASDTPEMAEVRTQLVEADQQLRDLAPDVTKAYQAARDRLTPAEDTAPIPDIVPVETSTDPFARLRELGILEEDTLLEQQSPSARRTVLNALNLPTSESGNIYIEPTAAWLAKEGLEPGTKVESNSLTPKELVEATTENKPSAEVIPFPEPAASKPPLNLNVLSQRRQDIATELAGKLIAAGQPADVARQGAALVQEYYRTKAVRFNGELGSPRDIFDKEFPDVTKALESEEKPGLRGHLSLLDNTIILFKKGDASTFVHESGHVWLEEMMRDAQHPQAPEDLKADLETVKTWLGMEGDTPSRKQHEQFARGFERYLMEGISPSSKLSSVFAKFKDWLTSLYQTVSRLRAPINDEIRGVYDRLLAPTKDQPVIAPEREVAQNFADVHEADAANAKPENALERADQVRAERDQIAQILTTEINNARLRSRVRRTDARTEPGREAAGDETGTGVSESGGTPAGGDTVREEPNQEPVAVSPSGDGFTAKGDAPKGDEPFGPDDGRLVDKAGNIRLENLNAPDEVDEIIRGVARYNNGFQEQRRGVMTAGQVKELAEDLGRRASFLDAKKIGEAFNAEEIEAARELLRQSANEVRNAFVTVDEGGDPLVLAKALAKNEMIAGKVAQATAEWGRAGQAFRRLNEFKETSDINSLDAFLKENTGRGYDQLQQMAYYGRNLKTSGKVNKFVNDTAFNRAVKAISFYYTNSLISGPFTHAVYAVGNELRAIAQIPQTAIQASIGAAREALGADATDRVYFREVGAAIYGLGTGTMKALPAALESFRENRQMPLPGQKNYNSPWTIYTPPGPQIVTDAIGLPGRTVGAIHQFSRVILYEQFKRRLAVRQALSEGLAGDALEARIVDLNSSPPEKLMADAAQKADTEMFQRHSDYRSLSAKLGQYTEQYPMAKLMFPFVKLPMEIQRETFIKHTPLGLLSNEVRGQLLGKEGGAMFDEALGKQIVGVGLLAGGATLAATGVINGFGPSDPDQNRVWKLNHNPYSVNVGNLSIPFQGLGPIGKLLQFGADLWETQHYWDGKDGTKLATGYAKAVERAVFDEGLFRDIVSLNSALDEPAVHGMRYLENFVTGFVPYSAALGQVNRHVIDPYQKSIEPGVNGVFDAIRARIPVASWSVENSRDMFGEPIPSRGMEGIDFLNIHVNRYENDPNVKWMDRLGGVRIGRLDRTIAGVQLTPPQYDDLARMSGRIAKIYLDTARPQLQSVPKGAQIKELENLVSKARHDARQLVMMQSMGSSNDIVRKASQKQLDLLQ